MSELAIQEAEELKAIRALPKDCKICGESSEYASMYGCPNAFDGKDGWPECPHDKHLRDKMDRDSIVHEIEKDVKGINKKIKKLKLLMDN